MSFEQPIWSNQSGYSNDSEDDDESPLQFLHMLMHGAQIQKQIDGLESGYRIVRKIGNWKQGELLLAEMESDQKDEAMLAMIKAVHHDDTHSGIINEDGCQLITGRNLEREAAILRQLEHPNIVKYVQYIRTTDQYILMTQYVENSISLRQFIKECHELINRTQMDVTIFNFVIKEIMRQLICALYWLHTDAHCCHLDLCTSNIVVNMKPSDVLQMKNDSSSVRLTLCDFSLSKIFSTVDDAGNICFDCEVQDQYADNASFVSPQVMDQQLYDARKADVWSFGMIMYECLTGGTLYDAQLAFSRCDMLPCTFDASSQNNCGYCALCYNDCLENYIKMKHPKMDAKAVQIICQALEFDEANRATASQLMSCEYFK